MFYKGYQKGGKSGFMEMCQFDTCLYRVSQKRLKFDRKLEGTNRLFISVIVSQISIWKNKTKLG